MNIKAHNEADVRHCSSDLCKATIVIGTDIWARVSTSNHCTVGGPWMCQKCSVFFSLFFFLNILSTRDSCDYQTSKIYLNSSTTERSQNFTQSRDKTIWEIKTFTLAESKVHKHYTFYTLVVYSRVLELSCHLHVTVLLNNVQYFAHLMLWNIAYVYSQFIKKPKVIHCKVYPRMQSYPRN